LLYIRINSNIRIDCPKEILLFEDGGVEKECQLGVVGWTYMGVGVHWQPQFDALFFAQLLR